MPPEKPVHLNVSALAGGTFNEHSFTVGHVALCGQDGYFRRLTIYFPEVTCKRCKRRMALRRR